MKVRNYWRLIAEPKRGEKKVFDLRGHRRLTVGDNADNDLSIDSTEVPFAFNLVRRNIKGEPVLRLTNEILLSLKGEHKILGNWATRLYGGVEVSPKGTLSFSIANFKFKLEEAETLPLEKLTTEKNASEDGRAARWTLLLFLLLLLFTGGLLQFKFWMNQNKEAALDIQKITVADIAKIKERYQPPVVVVEAAPEPSPAPAPVAKLAEKKPAQAAKAAQVAKGRTGVAPRKDVKTMGLLAIQGSIQAKPSTQLKVRPAAGIGNSKSRDLKGLGLGKALQGAGMGEGEGIQVASLGKYSGSSYSGDLKAGIGTENTPRIQLVRKEVVIKGALDPAVIRQIIEERLAEIRYCYENALLKDQTLAGKIAATWTIQSDGSVADIDSNSQEIAPAKLHPCVRSQIKAWKFPSPKGGGVVHVRYPFIFSPAGGEQ